MLGREKGKCLWCDGNIEETVFVFESWDGEGSHYCQKCLTDKKNFEKKLWELLNKIVGSKVADDQFFYYINELKEHMKKNRIN